MTGGRIAAGKRVDRSSSIESVYVARSPHIQAQAPLLRLVVDLSDNKSCNKPMQARLVHVNFIAANFCLVECCVLCAIKQQEAQLSLG